MIPGIVFRLFGIDTPASALVLTIVSAWFSGLTDRTVVDGLVNLVGRICEESSFWFRRIQTGRVQNYAMLMLFGIFAFVSIYLFMR